jgi:hypothetical protein
MSLCWGTGLPYGLHIRKTGANLPDGTSAGWMVLTSLNAAGTNRLTCLPKHGGARDSKFLVTHPMTDQRCLTFALARRSALTAGPSNNIIISFISDQYGILIETQHPRYLWSATDRQTEELVKEVSGMRPDVCIGFS